jgi:putative membrane protein
MDTEPVKMSDELAMERTDLAASRTLMAADRTLMAWVRTALSMISFGFTIYKLLEGFQKSGDLLNDPNTPRTVGLFLTGLGTASIIMGTVEYSQRLRQLQKLGDYRLRTPSFVIAVIILLTGAVLFVSIICRSF